MIIMTVIYSSQRRKFLTQSVASLAGLAILGCKKGRKSRRTEKGFDIVFLKDYRPDERDLSKFIDNTLENGFSFDFTSIDKNGLVFSQIENDGDKWYARDAQGYNILTDFEGIEKTWTIKAVQGDNRGMSMELTDGVNTLETAIDSPDDALFSGFEKSMNSEEVVNENMTRFNDLVQLDAYVRILGSVSKDQVVLKSIDKIRTPDNLGFEIPWSFPRSFEVSKIRGLQENVGNSRSFVTERGLKDDFSFDFSSQPLEARLDEYGSKDKPGIKTIFPAEFFDRSFTINGDDFMFRYVGVDTRQIDYSLSSGKQFPKDACFFEIIENPLPIDLEPNFPTEVSYLGNIYTIKLNEFNGFSSRAPEFKIEISDGMQSEKTVVKTYHHGVSNHVLGINIDPEVGSVWNFSHNLHPPPSFRVYLSKNKFSSALGYLRSGDFYGIQKSIDAKQVSANRINGEIEKSVMKISGRTGVECFLLGRSIFGPGYKVVEDPSFSGYDQRDKGYVVRITGIEKLSLI